VESHSQVDSARAGKSTEAAKPAAATARVIRSSEERRCQRSVEPALVKVIQDVRGVDADCEVVFMSSAETAGPAHHHHSSTTAGHDHLSTAATSTPAASLTTAAAGGCATSLTGASVSATRLVSVG